MLEINRSFTFGPRQILFNLNQFTNLFKNKPKKSLINSKSNSRSPIRIQGEKENRRSVSAESRKAIANASDRVGRSPSSSRRSPTIETNQMIENEENDNRENIYYSKKITRYNSLSDLTKFSNKFANLESTNTFFNDLSLNQSLIYYASSEGNVNGILFSQKNYDLNSNLFTRIFYLYVHSCFKIKSLFDNIQRFHVSVF